MIKKYIIPIAVFFVFMFLFFMVTYANIKAAEAQKASIQAEFSKNLAWEKTEELKSRIDINQMELAKAKLEINKLTRQLDECQGK